MASAPIVIPEIKVEAVTVRIEGRSPLICHKWSEKAKKEMLAKQMGKARVKKEPKNPEAEYESSLYEHPNGGYGFPAVAFKKAMTAACRYVEGVPMTFARGSFFVEGELVEVEGEPDIREDMVRLNGSTADIRYRGEFKTWTAELMITFNASAVTAEQVVNLLNIAGYSVGIGEHRPEKDGPYGRFRVVGQRG